MREDFDTLINIDQQIKCQLPRTRVPAPYPSPPLLALSLNPSQPKPDSGFPPSFPLPPGDAVFALAAAVKCEKIPRE